jgi:hypothetical protein
MVARELAKGGLRTEPGKVKLLETRNEARRAWRDVSDILIREGHSDLSAQVQKFMDGMPPPMIERERLAAELVERSREPRTRESPIR